jgi:hypothetical protein
MPNPAEDFRYLMGRQSQIEERLETARRLYDSFDRNHEAKARDAAAETVRLVEIELDCILFTIRRGYETGRFKRGMR